MNLKSIFSILLCIAIKSSLKSENVWIKIKAFKCVDPCSFNFISWNGVCTIFNWEKICLLAKNVRIKSEHTDIRIVILFLVL